jgi:hypothetical protein
MGLRLLRQTRLRAQRHRRLGDRLHCRAASLLGRQRRFNFVLPPPNEAADFYWPRQYAGRRPAVDRLLGNFLIAEPALERGNL